VRLTQCVSQQFVYRLQVQCECADTSPLIADKTIDVCYDASSKQGGADEFQVQWLLQVGEERETGAERDGMDQEAVFVDQAELYQAAGEICSSVGEDVFAGLSFQALHLFREVAIRDPG